MASSNETKELVQKITDKVIETEEDAARLLAGVFGGITGENPEEIEARLLTKEVRVIKS